MINQKDAVFAAISSLLSNEGITIDGDVAPLMTKDRRARVNQMLFFGFRNGQIELGREFTDHELRSYVSGLQSNWIRKDPRLNGGVKYAARNPGSRIGSGDAQLKALRALLNVKTDPQDRAEIQRFIERRESELQPKPTINLDDLPIELRKKFGM